MDFSKLYDANAVRILGVIAQYATVAAFMVATLSYCSASKTYKETSEQQSRSALYEFEMSYLDQISRIEQGLVRLGPNNASLSEEERENEIRALVLNLRLADAQFVMMNNFAVGSEQLSVAWEETKNSLCDFLREPSIGYFTNSHAQDHFLSQTRGLCRE